MATEVVIERRFRGPPESANGGYACGVVAEMLDPGERWVEATLRAPPPLDQTLEGRISAQGQAELTAGGSLVAEARFAPGPAELEMPAPPTLEDAGEAGRNCPWRGTHPFPMCFVCGADREPPDGLRIETGPLAGREVLADVWIPDPVYAGTDGSVRRELVWGALDCPSGNAAIWFGKPASQVLLGRLTARLIRPVKVGEPYVVLGWPAGRNGRKHWGGSSLVHAASGKTAGLALGLWIELKG